VIEMGTRGIKRYVTHGCVFDDRTALRYRCKAGETLYGIIEGMVFDFRMARGTEVKTCGFG